MQLFKAIGGGRQVAVILSMGPILPKTVARRLPPVA